jgi:uncharacterized OB-fold protein
MAEATRPLPRLTELDTQAFWEATADKELRYQQCGGCGKVVFYPRQHCTGCVDGALAWKISAGLGTVYTYSVVRQSYHPYFRDRVPYAIAWVDLDEGFRVLTNVVGVEDPLIDVSIGQRVRVTWEAHEDVCIPLFEPVG